ncbi:hypothetical protein PR048_005754 [Dryococelus australis]|uniref:Uncharacterized protein n=1 Tax=Dryococelus australis TaxID=614101 RepID=A0ABQ9I938_9NEOP|nr:hypothetical protein PR048_005754 [Dryococelus australis]
MLYSAITYGVCASVHGVQLEEEILEQFEAQPSISTRQVACEMGEQLLHPFHLRKVHVLHGDNFHHCITFAHWYLQQCISAPRFASHILFTDECTFTSKGIHNMNNIHIWASENPHAFHISGHQVRFCVDVWCCVVGDMLLGPYVLVQRLTGAVYLEFLTSTLPDQLDDDST